MSATGRGGERVEGDAYDTPAWCVEAILPKIHVAFAPCFFDPFAGIGAILRTVLLSSRLPAIDRVFGFDLPESARKRIAS